MTDEGVIVSVAEDSFPFAVAEFEGAFGASVRVRRWGPDVGVLTGDGITLAEVARRCLATPLLFPRHLTAVAAQLSAAESKDVANIGRAALAAVEDAGWGPRFAVQSWASGTAQFGYNSAEAFRNIAEVLRDEGYEVGRAGEEHVLSCCVTPNGVLLGLGDARHSLSDWPGGRVRLARDEAQISRAEFKLEELFHVFPIDLPTRGRAIDYGAAPGGWTRVLRAQGMDVWAIDPGDLDPRLLADRGVHHLRTTAGEFLRSNRSEFDLVVNDMRMDPTLSCQLMNDTARHLRPGGLAIITLKTGTRRVLDTIDNCLRLLGREYELLHARQLHHNRHEVTVVVRRR
ncbi:SAM-dependent methyltransferase [Longispora urticae]